MHGSTSRCIYIYNPQIQCMEAQVGFQNTYMDLYFFPFILYFIEQLILLNCSSISSNLLTNTRSKFLDFFSL